MRVVAGRLGGRTFEAPKGHRTHPMGDKVRGALFNVLGDLTGCTVLDAFAGSGALGIEAISRGATRASLIESDRAAIDTIQRNIQSLDLEDQVKVIKANAGGWSDNNSAAQFDIVFCDPPYDKPQLQLLSKLAKHVKPRGILACSLPPQTGLQLPDGFIELSRKGYGDAMLVFYRRVQ